MIRTLEQAKAEQFRVYRTDTCEHCKTDLVIPQDELNNYFFGKPEVEKDESVYKCPVCGHPNIRKTADLGVCYFDGGTNLRFELSDEETESAKEFRKAHQHKEEFAEQGKTFFSAMGQQFTYEITPGGLGHCVSIKCNECGETKDITDSKGW